MDNCQRCNKPAIATTMSRFNTDMICLKCEKKEQEHPDYPAARAAEEEAVKRGNMNFPGVGLPAGL